MQTFVCLPVADSEFGTHAGRVQVQTFMCLPLADSGGVVEWVLNTQTYHSILRETYANANKPAATSHSRAEWDTAKARMGKPPKDPQALAKWFRARLDVAPPVMHEWWLATCAAGACVVHVACSRCEQTVSRHVHVRLHSHRQAGDTRMGILSSY